MLSIQGSLQILPDSVQADEGTVRINDEETPAVVISYVTQSGIVQVILPAEFVDSIADGMKEAKKRSEGKADIYIPQGGMNEAEQIAKAKEGIEKNVGAN
jgi:hypothetical protein